MLGGKEHWGARWLGRLLFAAALLLFLLSLLTLVSAPTSLLWIASILVAEWGHYAALVGFLIALIAWRRAEKWTVAGALLAAALCLSPALRAAWIARSLPTRCTAAFGQASKSSRTSPFSLLTLIRGTPTSGVEVTEHDYAVDGAKPLQLDLYQTADTFTPQPLIIMVHGGSWNGGNKEQLPAINRHLAHEQYTVASINYRHTPRWPFPAAVDDLFRAVEFLKSNASELRIDPTRIVLMGRSAGGQIALSAAYAGRESGIRGVVSFYAPADMVLGYEKPSRRAVLDSKKMLEDYLGGSPATNDSQYAVASPINFVDQATPPTLLIHGDLDPIVWPIQSASLAARLEQAHRPHLLLQLPWATHGCDANSNGPSGQLSLYAIDRFLASVFVQSGAALPATRTD